MRVRDLSQAAWTAHHDRESMDTEGWVGLLAHRRLQEEWATHYDLRQHIAQLAEQVLVAAYVAGRKSGDPGARLTWAVQEAEEFRQAALARWMPPEPPSIAGEEK